MAQCSRVDHLSACAAAVLFELIGTTLFIFAVFSVAAASREPLTVAIAAGGAVTVIC